MPFQTEYLATLRCQTWNVWPEKTVIQVGSILLDLGTGNQVSAQLSVCSHLNRSKPEEYAAERTEEGRLVWRGLIPGQYLVHDAVLKSPEDIITVAMEHEHARRGEVDIVITFKVDGKLKANTHESIRCTTFACMSLINLRLGDFLTPVAPLQISEILGSKSQVVSTVRLEVRSRKTLEKHGLTQAFSQIGQILSTESNPEKLRTALELYGSHFFERQARTRFLLLVIAFEALTTPTRKSQAALKLISKWQEDLSAEKQRYAKFSEEYDALDALAHELFYRQEDSIRSQIRKLFCSIADEAGGSFADLPRRALKIYDLRSKLVHDGSIPPADLEAAEDEARKLLETAINTLIVKQG